MTQRKDRENEPKPSRFGLGKKEWLFVNGLLTLRLWFNIPRGATELTGTIYGQTITSTPTATGLTMVDVPGVDPQLSPRLDVTCTTGTGEVLTHTQDITAEQPTNSEQMNVQWRDFQVDRQLFLEVGARVLSLAGRVIPPVPVRFMLGNDKRDPIPTDAKGIAQTTFGPLEYNRTYILLVATPSSGERTTPITIKPARAVKYDIRELVVKTRRPRPVMFQLRINVWDDVKGIPLSGLHVNVHVGAVHQSAITDDNGIAEITCPFDEGSDVTHYRIIVEDGKDKKSYIRRPTAARSTVATPTDAPRSFREAFRAARNPQRRKE
ncbi:MAG: hypothetical protein AAB424_00730 [Patescibacteria group bacterium]